MKTGVYMSVIHLCMTLTRGSPDTFDDLKARLRYFEVMHPSDIAAGVRSKRSPSGSLSGVPGQGIRELKFSTLGRPFHLYMTHDRSIFAPGFEASAIDASGKSSPIFIDPDAFLVGHVAGEEDSSATLHWEGDAVNAKIVTADDVYYIEPSWRHLPDSTNYTMLAYKGSDLKTNAKADEQFCTGLHAPTVNSSVDDETHNTKDTTEGTAGTRRRRMVQTYNACHLYIVADFQFYSKIASSDETRAVNYMIDLVTRVDKMYRRTTWANQWNDLGFTIKKLLVHTTWSPSSASYNVQSSGWDVNGLLDAFGEVSTKKEPYNNYCLAHLFTAYSFSNGVLGLAYIASPQQGALGGICSNTYFNANAQKDYYLNTGWSSAVNKAGSKILTQEAEIVLAHELGHNWGSEHDPATSDCSPSTSDGKYIMYTYAVSGFDPNNNLFSPCSKRSIGQVLNLKSQRCFQVRLDSLRGNYRVDDGEQCDAGIVGSDCCSTDFKLQPRATCSDTNDVCCTNCSVGAARGKQCRGQSELTCEANATCNGVNKTCPLKYNDVGTKCLPDGSGRCLTTAIDGSSTSMYCATFCEVLGMVSCSCQDVLNSCYLCCRQNISSACLPYDKHSYRDHVGPCNGSSKKVCLKSRQIVFFDSYGYANDSGHIILSSGSSCIVGYCDAQGICIKQSQDQLTRFWDFITHLTPSEIVQFMRDNIVGTIIVFSFVLWLPASIFIACIDKKREKQEAEIAAPAWSGTLTRVNRPPIANPPAQESVVSRSTMI